ncbi:eukaryotic translation elongation factor 1 epsilon-1-like [Huso huso]|uniref:Eukaryotic translation elongation factor 1 epsilon-1-like n=1 Tax=Huso huso TaxID=61971 RepID=A0ABR1A5B4_HUSHU|nr:eukaryotic translation elongation factor 1 epsilon-1-like [Acipenser ruthenus]
MSDKVVLELLSLEKSLGLKKTNKYSTQGDKQVPVLQTNNGPNLIGLTTIAAHLVQEAQQKQLLGNTAEEKAIVQQWLEYRVTQIDGHRGKDETRTVLKDLNQYLEDKVYLAGDDFTLADILVYYGLHPIMTELAVQEKEKYVNVSRWFNHIQHYPGIRQHLPPVVVLKNRLYTSVH